MTKQKTKPDGMSSSHCHPSDSSENIMFSSFRRWVANVLPIARTFRDGALRARSDLC
jgi:hypothetical protein